MTDVIRLEAHLRARRAAGHKLLVPYVTGGLLGWEQAVRAAADGGADAIEIGIPFSDPVMDGPVIQEASQRALDADESDREVGEAAEDADGVRAAAHTGDDDIGVAARELSTLLPALVTDHTVELTHHPGVRVRPHHGTEAVVRVADGRHPVAHRLVDRVLQRPAAALDRFDLGTEQAHPEHVEGLTLDVDGAHVHLALEAEQRSGGRARHTVLAGAGLGHDAGLAHPLGQQRLADDVVDLVRPRVIEILALQQQADPELPPEVVALREDRRAAGVVA